MARNIFLIAGPSGSGKTTLTQALVQRIPHLTKAITVTTRLQRPGEVDGVDYHFVSAERFFDMEQGGELIETDHAYNEDYGIPRAAFDVACDVAIVITVDGALEIKRRMANAVSLFILPACSETASARVAARNSPNADSRIAQYREEVLAARHFDRVFLNLDFSQCLDQMERATLSLGVRNPLQGRVSQ